MNVFRLIVKAVMLGLGAWVGSWVARSYFIRYDLGNGTTSTGFVDSRAGLGLDDAVHVTSMGAGALLFTKVASKFLG
jgi:hypothetical protein